MPPYECLFLLIILSTHLYQPTLNYRLYGCIKYRDKQQDHCYGYHIIA